MNVDQEDKWDPPANPHAHDTLMMGDSVGCEGSLSAATLGPILMVFEKRHFLVSSQVFGQHMNGDTEPIGVRLVHPAPVDCPPGEMPRPIGVFKCWSGPLYRTYRKSKLTGYDIVTDWALFEVYDDVKATNRLRYTPRGREFQGKSGIISGFFMTNPTLMLVRSSGRSSGIRWSVICETNASVGQGTRWTREYFLEHYTGLGMNAAEWVSGGPGIPGDSGACVIDDESRRLIGMIWGRNVYAGALNTPRFTYFTHILDILDDIQERYPQLGRPTLATDSDWGLFSADSAASSPVGQLQQSNITEPSESTWVDFGKKTHCDDFGDPESPISDTESVFSDMGSYSSQSSVHGPEARALNEILAALFMDEAAIREAFAVELDAEGVGAERITTELRRALREMGKSLTGDSKNLEQRTCAKRLRRKADFIADSLRRKYDPEFQARQLNVDVAPMPAEDQRRFIMSMWQRPQQAQKQRIHQVESREESDSSDEDQIDPEIEEALSLKIKEVEDFILGSQQMMVLKHRLRVFAARRNMTQRAKKILGKGPSLPQIIRDWLPQRPGFVWESSVPAGAERIRWTCTCGTELYDDYLEVREGGLKRLKASLATISSISSGNPASGPDSAATTSLHVPGNWLSSMSNSVGRALGRAQRGKNGSGLPAPNRVGAPLDAKVSQSDRQLLYLLCCIQAGVHGMRLHQPRVLSSDLKDDNAFFSFIRDAYYSERKQLSRLRLREISGVGHCKLRVDFSEFASVHKHNTSCSPDPVSPCPCWPPPDLIGKEYACVDTSPPDVSPSVGPNYLLHYLEHPEHLRTGQKLLVRHVPLRMGARLAAGEAEMRPGWGIYFEEDWHVKTICVVVSVLLLIASLAFGFIFGWDVGSFSVTATTVVLMVLGTLMNRSF